MNARVETAPRGALRLDLAAGERLFVNGAVLAVDRRVAVTLLNRAAILRGANVMQAEEATTPLRRLYFAAQRGLVSPGEATAAALEAGALTEALLAAVSTPALVSGLLDAREALGRGEPFAAMRAVRPLFALEARLLEAAA